MLDLQKELNSLDKADYDMLKDYSYFQNLPDRLKSDPIIQGLSVLKNYSEHDVYHDIVNHLNDLSDKTLNEYLKDSKVVNHLLNDNPKNLNMLNTINQELSIHIKKLEISKNKSTLDTLIEKTKNKVEQQEIKGKVKTIEPKEQTKTR